MTAFDSVVTTLHQFTIKPNRVDSGVPTQFDTGMSNALDINWGFDSRTPQGMPWSDFWWQNCVDLMLDAIQQELLADGKDFNPQVMDSGTGTGYVIVNYGAV